jgi:hypothetical protein
MLLCETMSRNVCRGVSSLLVLLALIAARPALAAKDQVPDWVHTAMAQPLPAYGPETRAVVLLDETTLSVAADGKVVQRYRYVVKILRPNGRGEGVVEIPFDKETKLLSLHVWSVDPDGREYAVKDSEMTERSYGEGNYYVDMKYKTATPPGRDPGGVIAYEYEQRFPPYMQEDTWGFQSSLPRLKQSYTLELPPGYTFGTVWAHHPKMEAIDLEHQRYRWEIDQVPGIDLERVPLRPPMGALAGRMTVYFGPVGGVGSQLGTWKGIGEWYDALSHDRLAANPEIAAKAAELTAGKTDFYDKSEAIGEFVQKQIRYFVIERGIGGLQPHPAAEIFRNRYGDCKDKATLLSAMLSSVGIHSVIVLVDTRRGVVDVDAPSLVGNHAIAAIEIPKGYSSPKLRSVVTTKAGRRYLIFDPTWEKTAFGQLEANLQGSYGTLVDGPDSDEIRMPVLSPELNTVQRTASFQLQPDGMLKGSVVEKRFGDLSDDNRYLYSYGDAKQQKEYMNRVLSQDFVSFEVSHVKVENADALNKELTTTFDLSADRYGRTMGQLLMVRPRVVGSEGMALDHKVRKVPIDLEQTMQAKDDFTIELPPGYAVDETPDPVKLDVGFAAYESSVEVHGSSLHYRRTYTVREVSVPADRYPDVQKLAGVIDADEQNHAVFKKQ